MVFSLKKLLPKNAADMVPLAIAAVVFLAVPSLTDGILYLTDNILVRGVLIAVCIAALQYDMLFGIFTFLVVTRIFLERNNRKIQDAKAVIVANAPKAEVVLADAGGEIADVEAKVDRQVYSPPGDELPYIPTDDSGDNTFKPVDYTLDEKRVLTGVPEGEVAARTVFSDVRPGNFTNEV